MSDSGRERNGHGDAVSLCRVQFPDSLIKVLRIDGVNHVVRSNERASGPATSGRVKVSELAAMPVSQMQRSVQHVVSAGAAIVVKVAVS